MAWEQYVIESAPTGLEQIEQVLLDCGAVAVSLEDAGDVPILEPAPGQTPLWPRMRIRALFETGAGKDSVGARLLGLLPLGSIATIEPVGDEDWTRAWLAHARPIWFGDRLCVTPAELAPPEGRAAIVKLDPGLAFGTGTHATTRLCMKWLDTNLRGGESVLDYGCGSGILGIAALKLGAARATGVDIDPLALLAARHNAMQNQVHMAFVAAERDAPEPADIVLANILANPLTLLAPLLARLTRRGGHILLSGVLEHQAREVEDAYRAAFDLAPLEHDDGWVLISGSKR